MAREIKAGTAPIKTEVNTGFKPLKAGRYEATIFALEDGEYTTAKNKGLPNLTVQYRISDGQVGANRRHFDQFPMAPNWLNGEDAFRFHQFGAVVTDRTEEEFRKYVEEQQKAGEPIELPDDADLLGFPVTLTLKVVDDDYAYKKALKTNPDAKQSDYQKNQITSISPAGGGTAEAGGDSATEARPKAQTLDL